MKVITIGRSSSNDVVIDDAKVSKKHLQIVVNDGGKYSAVDLNSLNGTFVNGQKITGEVRLQMKDVIRIGDTILPWQNYINVPDSTPSSPAKKSNKVWLYAIAGVVLVLVAIGFGAGFLLYPCNEKGNSIDLSSPEPDSTVIKELEDSARLLLMQGEIEIVINQLTEAERAKSSMQTVIKNLKEDTTRLAKKVTQLQKTITEQGETITEQGETIAQLEKNNETLRGNNRTLEKQKKEAVQDVIDILTDFYNEYKRMTLDDARQVIKNRKTDSEEVADPKEVAYPKEEIIHLFFQVSNEGRKTLIKEIQAAKNNNSSDSEPIN